MPPFEPVSISFHSRHAMNWLGIKHYKIQAHAYLPHIFDDTNKMFEPRNHLTINACH